MNYGQVRTMLENQEAIREQYFKTSFMGSGTTEASFAIPFNPDVLYIAGFSANQSSAANLYVSVALDAKSEGYWGASVVYTNGNKGVSANGIKRASLDGNFSYESGIFTWNFSSQPWVFSPDCRYYVTAAKFPG